jgi:hypothetical protein
MSIHEQLHLNVYKHIRIYIYIERERGSMASSNAVSLYIYTYIYIYIYIYRSVCAKSTATRRRVRRCSSERKRRCTRATKCSPQRVRHGSLPLCKALQHLALCSRPISQQRRNIYTRQPPSWHSLQSTQRTRSLKAQRSSCLSLLRSHTRSRRRQALLTRHSSSSSRRCLLSSSVPTWTVRKLACSVQGVRSRADGMARVIIRGWRAIRSLNTANLVSLQILVEIYKYICSPVAVEGELSGLWTREISRVWKFWWRRKKRKVLSPRTRISALLAADMLY